MELSVESRLFVNRVNDQVRKRQNRISNVAGDGEELSIVMGNVYGCNSGISSFRERISKTIVTPLWIWQISHSNKSSHICEIVAEQDEISGLETIGWEKHSWKYLLLIGDERIINLQRTEVYVFSDFVLSLGRIHQNPESKKHGNKEWDGWPLLKATETLTESVEIRLNSSGTFSQDSPRCSSSTKSKILTEQIRRNTRNFHRKNFIYVDVQRHFLLNKRQWTRMFGKRSTRILVCKTIWYKTMVIHWSRFRKEVVFYERTVHKESGIISMKRCWWNS